MPELGRERLVEVPRPISEARTSTEFAPLTPGARTRFAPAPTGYLHLGHVANAVWVWGAAARTGGHVLLRIEDHDRLRSRPIYDSALIEDLAWLEFVPDEGPIRQSDDDEPYATACARLRADGLVKSRPYKDENGVVIRWLVLRTLAPRGGDE